MYKGFLLILFTFTLIAAKAQVWIDSGAVWHYHSSSPWTISYTKLEYVKDTLINSQLCQKITSESRSFIADSPPNTYYAFPVSTGMPQFTYASGDTVFYLADDGFRILCDFGAQVGDSWVGMTYTNDMGNTDSLVVSVKEIGTISINNNYYRYVDLAADTCFNYGYGGRFVERFGFYQTREYSGLSNFPYTHGCNGIVETFGSGLYCFNDASFQLNGFTGEACEFPDIEILGKDEIIVADFNVFPNHTKDKLYFNNLSKDENNLTICDISGKIVLNVQNISAGAPVDVSYLTSGIYLLQLNQGGKIETKKIVIQ